MQGLYKSIKNICGKYDIQKYFKANKTLKNIPITPKDQDQTQQKYRVIYGANATDWTAIKNTWENQL